MPAQDLANLVLLLASLALGAAVLLPRRRREHRPWGIRPDRGTLPRYLLGLGLGALTTAAAGVVLMGSGLSTVTAGTPEAFEIVALVVYFLVLALVEELVFRGLLQGAVLELTGRAVVAVPLVAVAVAVPYLFADGVTPLTFVSAVLAGLMYGVITVVTGSVWAAAGLRAAWNLTLGPVLGFTVSGAQLAEQPVLQQAVSGPTWLTGGDYGPEGGAIVVAARVLLITALLLLAARGILRPRRTAARSTAQT